MNPDRRDFLALGIGALALAASPVLVRRRDTLVRRQIPAMGTVAEVAVRHRDSAWAQRGIDAAFAELRRVEATMTRFRPDSDVGRVNGAGGRLAEVCDDTSFVLGEALVWAAASKGRFDPCLGRVSELWDVARRSAPPEVGDESFGGLEMWRALELRREGSVGRVRLDHTQAALDLGGIAKGFGVDVAAQALRDHGIFHALVNVGGDLVSLGVDADHEPWRIGVRSPLQPDEIIDQIAISDRAVATSGDYLAFFQHRGRRYHHLLDPLTGEPRESLMRSLTVEADRCLTADAAATALFGATSADASQILGVAAPAARVVHSV